MLNNSMVISGFGTSDDASFNYIFTILNQRYLSMYEGQAALIWTNASGTRI